MKEQLAAFTQTVLTNVAAESIHLGLVVAGAVISLHPGNAWLATGSGLMAAGLKSMKGAGQ
jgi:hypothetical protein